MATIICRRLLASRVSSIFQPIYHVPAIQIKQDFIWDRFNYVQEYKQPHVKRYSTNDSCEKSKNTADQCGKLRDKTQEICAKTQEHEAKQEPEVKLSIFKRFKQMYRDYWYVLVPVHLVTSAGWFGGFYYLAKSGVDVVALMESCNISEKITNPLKDSSMGYLAISYALYKIATPIRYTVTLGGTTISINYLKKWGYIRPVPSTQQLKNIYKEKKENIIDTMKDKKEEFILKKEQLKDRTDNLLDDMEKKIITKINDSKEQFNVKKTAAVKNLDKE